MFRRSKITTCLEDLKLPVEKYDIVERVCYSGASPELLNTVNKIPCRVYTSVSEIVTEIVKLSDDDIEVVFISAIKANIKQLSPLEEPLKLAAASRL